MTPAERIAAELAEVRRILEKLLAIEERRQSDRDRKDPTRPGRLTDAEAADIVARKVRRVK